ncbi:MAG: cytochrome-c oxidase, cbb3-type subunit III [Burkholderiales bacterium]|jgi:cytochrome c oxidase cbb3-type subunit 3|nr:cytochrome-c oxidase, cbb3-type subunit III [Burkholderiales bacterium]
MSDFTSNFWNLYIAILTIAGIIFCIWLLVAVGKREQKSSDSSHVWDGDLTELNNQLPGWWRWMFWGLLIFSIGYLVYFPGLGSFKGTGDWTQIKQFDEEMTALQAKTKPTYDSYLAMAAEDLSKNKNAMETAGRIFSNECARCHGSDAGGGAGFPSLKSGDAMSWGGDVAAIKQSITEGRTGVMTPMGEAVGGAPGVKAVVAYMRSLSGLSHDEGLMAQGGKLFEDNCAACHGADGKGVKEMGAPNLTDNIWVYGGSEAAMTKVVELGKNSNLAQGDFAMPAYKGVLSQAQIHLLTAYVWGKSHK